MSRPAGRSATGPTILVTRVGAATGSRAVAAVLACVASETDRAALLVDFDDARAPRSTLVSTAGARELEERLVAHLPDVAVASRGRICSLKLSPDGAGIERLAAALPLVREAAGVVHLPPDLLHPILEERRVRATGALLRADLPGDRALTALAVRNLIALRLRVAVLKRPPGWLAARAGLLGALPTAWDATLPTRLSERLLRANGGGATHRRR